MLRDRASADEIPSWDSELASQMEVEIGNDVGGRRGLWPGGRAESVVGWPRWNRHHAARASVETSSTRVDAHG